MAAPVIRSSSTAANGAAPTALSVARPAGTADGDLLLAFVLISGDQTITSVPSGWVQLDQKNTGVATGDPRHAVYRKFASSEPASWSWGWSAGSDATIIVVAYTGVDATSPINVTASRLMSGSTLTHTGPSVSPSVDTTVTLYAYGVNPAFNGDLTFTTPSGLVPVAEADPGAGTTNRAVLKLFSKDTPTTAATGDQVTTINNSGKGIAYTITLAPSGAAPQTITVTPYRESAAATGCMMGWYDHDGLTGLHNMEDVLGTKFAIVRVYNQWWPNVSSSTPGLVADGRLIFASHKPPKYANSWIEIADTTIHDSAIAAMVQYYKGFAPNEVLFVFNHEPHGAASDGGGKTPKYGSQADFVKAYRKIGKAFRDAGATNVKLGYCAVDSWAETVPDKSYPGDDLVDVICHDYYAWGTYSGHSWKSPSVLLTPLVNLAKAQNKPVIIGEIGIHPTEGANSRKQWIKDLADFLKTGDAKTYILGFCYYHVDNHDGSGHYWRFAEGVTAGTDKDGFIEKFSNDPYFLTDPIPASLTGATADPVDTGGGTPSGGTPPKVAGSSWTTLVTTDGVLHTEVSGLCSSPKGGAWALRDSGNEASLFWYTQTSRGVFASHEVPVTGATNSDWEDCIYSVEGGTAYIYIHDNRDGNSTGANPRRLYKAVEPATPSTATAMALVGTYYWSFPGTASSSTCGSQQNCEAIFIFNGVHYAVQKTDASEAEVYMLGAIGALSTNSGAPTIGTLVGTIAMHCPSAFSVSADGTTVVTIQHGQIKVFRGKGDTVQSLLTGKNTLLQTYSATGSWEAADWYPYQSSDFLAIGEEKSTFDADVEAGQIIGSGIPSGVAFGNLVATMPGGAITAFDVGAITSAADYEPPEEEAGINFGTMTAYTAPLSAGDPLEFAIYGVSFYGTARYGLPPAVDFSLAFFTAEPDGYDTIRVEWQHPSGTWDRLKLVRGAYGFPTDEIDGTLVLQAAVDAATGITLGLPADPQGYVDTDVKPLRFYYYSIFLRVVSTGAWVKAGDALALMTKDYSSAQRLFDLVPSVYRDTDLYISSNTGVGELESFLQTIGYEADTIRTELESLLWTGDPTKMSGGLLPLLAAQFGFPFESELGMLLVRRQLLNAVYLYKMKGTRLGIEGAVSVLTGWAPTIAVVGANDLDVTVAADRVNRITNPSAETNATLWTGTNATITRVTSQFLYGAASFQMAVTANGDAAMASANMPVTAGQTYTGSLYNFKASGTPRQVRAGIIWKDGGGAQVAADDGSPVTQTLASWVNRPSVTGTAPEAATQASLVANVLAGGAGENQYFDGVLFEQGAQLQAYFDSAVGTPGSDYLWEGTTHLSRSHYYHRRAMKNSRLLARLPDFLPLNTTFSTLFAQGV